MHCGYIYNLAQHACSSILAAPLQQCSENFLLSHFDYNISYAMAKGVILMYLCKIWYKNMQVVCLDITKQNVVFLTSWEKGSSFVQELAVLVFKIKIKVDKVFVPSSTDFVTDIIAAPRLLFNSQLFTYLMVVV